MGSCCGSKHEVKNPTKKVVMKTRALIIPMTYLKR